MGIHGAPPPAQFRGRTDQGMMATLRHIQCLLDESIKGWGPSPSRIDEQIKGLQVMPALPDDAVGNGHAVVVPRIPEGSFCC